jgi:UDP-N-acetylmuramyl tripeptide synthase
MRHEPLRSAMWSARDRFAYWSGAAARAAVRLAHAGDGTSLPGRVAELVSPGFTQRRVARFGDVILVSGTNGKTTTASMIRHILRSSGRSVVGNEAGANLRQGIASSLIVSSEGTPTVVLEVDELTLPEIVRKTRPRAVVLTNVFRDQLDRHAESERVLDVLAASCDPFPETVVVFNTDDPALSHIVSQKDGVGFAVEREGDASRVDGRLTSPIVEAEVCPRCGRSLGYGSRTILHLGRARCPACGWKSPDPERLARIRSMDGLRSMRLDVSGTPVSLSVGGVHNAYNAVAAIAATSLLGVSDEEASLALRSFRPRFGRAEHLLADGYPILLTLMKNPAAASVLIEEIAADPDVGATILSVNDALADGRDISWIWDIDVERLVRAGIPLVASGSRALDVSIRIKYAGSEATAFHRGARAAIGAAADVCRPGRSIVQMATYTAMLDSRRALRGRSGRLRDSTYRAAV